MKRRRISKAHYLCSLNVDREIVAVLGFMQNGGLRVVIEILSHISLFSI